MLSRNEKIALIRKLDKVTTFDQLSKIATLDQLTRLYKSYLTSLLYHVDRNKEQARLAKLAKDAGLDK